MIYQVIGTMSGSSLDGLDLCFARFEEVRGKWTAEILQADCVPYDNEMLMQLREAHLQSVPAFLRLHTAYGRYCGEVINEFIARYELHHKVHFIASHGHTVWHEPQSQTTFQIGEGASIAAVTGLPVVSDLRAMDVALGGQGAPIVPVGDMLLFGEHQLLLNIGGIANITFKEPQLAAFDVCVANQALNAAAALAGKDFDEDGKLARNGKLLPEIYAELCNAEYYTLPGPKSLSNAQAFGFVAEFIADERFSPQDKLHTLVHLIAEQIANAVRNNLPQDDKQRSLLVTGGGALNSFLTETIEAKIADLNVQLTVPEKAMCLYKEALVMGLIGILRWREEDNVFANFTGAKRNSIGGAYWPGA